jgi:hypothetical protein
MQRRARSALLSAITVFAAAVSAFTLLPPISPAAADTCLTAPNAPAPQGAHWYYRIERPSLRKCWRLVQKDPQVQGAPAQAAPPTEPVARFDAAPAAAARTPAGRTAEPVAEPAPLAPVIRDLVTRNVSNPSDAPQPLPPPDPPADAMPRAEIPSAPAASEQAPEPVPAANAEQPLPAVSTAANASVSDGTPTLRLLLGALALFGLVACATFFVMEMLRRRTDVLNTVRETNSIPVEMPPEVSAAAESPTFAPLPPIGLPSREDDVDEALRRFAQNVRRRAA